MADLGTRLYLPELDDATAPTPCTAMPWTPCC